MARRSAIVFLLWLGKNNWLSTADVYFKGVAFGLLVLIFSRHGLNGQAEFHPIRAVPSLLNVRDSKTVDRATVECETSRGRANHCPCPLAR